MKKLLTIELNKLRNFRAFWVLTGMYFIGLSATLLTIQGIITSFANNPMDFLSFDTFPEVWHYLGYIGGYFHYILAVIVIILICSEFNYKTVRQNIITGLSRTEWMLGKFHLMVFFALCSTLIYFLCTMAVGLINTEGTELGLMMSKAHFVFAFFIQTLVYLMLAILIGMIVRNTGIAIGIFMIYSWIIEKVIIWKLPDEIAQFFPLQASNDMIQWPFLNEILAMSRQDGPNWTAIVISIAWIGIFYFLGHLYLKKKDI